MFCSVSSWSSRAHRRRSSSAAARRCRCCSAAAEVAVATAVAALAAKASSSRWSSAVKRGSFEPVERDEDAVGAVAEDERHDEPALGADPELAQTVLLEAGAVQLLLQPVRPPRAQRRARHRLLQRDAHADQPVGKLAGAGGDDQLVAVLELDQERARGHERAPALGDELEDGRRDRSGPPTARVICVVASSAATVRSSSSWRSRAPVKRPA